MNRSGTILLAAGILLGAVRAKGGGFTIIEVGARKTGMMTGIARPDDLTAVYHNPAGLADQRGTRLHLSSGFCFVDADLRLRAWEGSDGYIDTPVGPDGYFEGTIKPTRYFGVMPMFVASSDFGFEEGPVAAFSVYVPDFIGAFMPEDVPSRYLVTEGYFIAGVTSLSLGWRLPEPFSRVSVGGSLGALYIRQEGKKWLNPLRLPHYEYRIHIVGEDWRPFYNLGVTVDLPGNVTLGASFIGGASVEMKGRLDIELAPGTETDLFSGVGGLAGNYRLKKMTAEVPPGLNLGISWDIIPELEVAADFRYWFYRVYEVQRIETNITDVKPGLSSFLKPETFNTPKDYEDSWTISLGARARPFAALPLDLMAGWTYDHSPAPGKTKSLDSPTVNLTGFSLGARYFLGQHWRFSATYYRYWYLHQEVTDSVLDPPQNSEFSGTVDTISVQTEVVF